MDLAVAAVAGVRWDWENLKCVRDTVHPLHHYLDLLCPGKNSPSLEGPLQGLKDINPSKFVMNSGTFTLPTVVLACSGCSNRVPRTGWLKQKFNVSKFWRLQLKVLVGPCFLWKTCRGDPFLPLAASGRLCYFLVCGSTVPSLSSHHLSSLCVCLCVPVFPFYRDASHIGLEPTLMISFWLDYLCKGPISKLSDVLRFWGLGFRYNFLEWHLICRNHAIKEVLLSFIDAI